MPEAQDTEERPCLHCMIVELIEDFFAEYPAASGEPDAIDTDEVIIALANNYCACKDSGGFNVQPEQYGSPADNRNLDARNYGVRRRVSSEGRIRCGQLSCAALAATIPACSQATYLANCRSGCNLCSKTRPLRVFAEGL